MVASYIACLMVHYINVCFLAYIVIRNVLPALNWSNAFCRGVLIWMTASVLWSKIRVIAVWWGLPWWYCGLLYYYYYYYYYYCCCCCCCCCCYYYYRVFWTNRSPLLHKLLVHLYPLPIMMEKFKCSKMFFASTHFWKFGNSVHLSNSWHLSQNEL